MKKLDNLIESFFENIDAIPCSAYDIEKDFEVLTDNIFSKY